MSLRWGWPSGAGQGQGCSGDWTSLLKHGGVKDEAEARACAKNPVAYLAPPAAAQIPLIYPMGDEDPAVPVAENTHRIGQRYPALGGLMVAIHKARVDHHRKPRSPELPARPGRNLWPFRPQRRSRHARIVSVSLATVNGFCRKFTPSCRSSPPRPATSPG